ncbi:hypothetical protein [Spirulina major]|uniref:hypothetical protein n=1 Tax=Spirulina major TaxID=270636 RepID=UPI0009330FAD|nr:hypothetical protein [Spirulina major]
MQYVEVKTRKFIYPGLARTLIAKGSIAAVVTTGQISQTAKMLFDEAGIAWAERIPEAEFMTVEAEEE